MCYGWEARYSTKGLGETKCALAGTQGTVQKVFKRISLLLLGRKVQYKSIRTVIVRMLLIFNHILVTEKCKQTLSSSP